MAKPQPAGGQLAQRPRCGSQPGAIQCCRRLSLPWRPRGSRGPGASRLALPRPRWTVGAHAADTTLPPTARLQREPACGLALESCGVSGPGLSAASGQAPSSPRAPLPLQGASPSLCLGCSGSKSTHARGGAWGACRAQVAGRHAGSVSRGRWRPPPAPWPGRLFSLRPVGAPRWGCSAVGMLRPHLPLLPRPRMDLPAASTPHPNQPTPVQPQPLREVVTPALEGPRAEGAATTRSRQKHVKRVRPWSVRKGQPCPHVDLAQGGWFRRLTPGLCDDKSG